MGAEAERPEPVRVDSKLGLALGGPQTVFQRRYANDW